MLRTTTRNKLGGVGVKPRFLHGSVDEVSFLGVRTLKNSRVGLTGSWPRGEPAYELAACQLWRRG